MKKLLISAVFFIFLNSMVSAYGLRYYWSFGDIGFSWDNIARKYELLGFLNVGNFNWITPHGFGFGINVFNFEGSSDWTQTLILPAEINYSPFRNSDNNPILTFYGRGGLMTRFERYSEKSFRQRSSFCGAA